MPGCSPRTSRGKPTLTMRIILVRHGETEDNRNKVLQGHRNGQLTEVGVRQIARLASRLRTEPIARIYTSDLERACLTALAVNKYHSVEIVPTTLLRERNLGDFEGRPIDDYLIHLKESNSDRFTHAPVDGESIAEVEIRAKQFLASLLPLHSQETVLISAHGLYNRALLNFLLGRSLDRIFELEQENTCVNILQRTTASQAGATVAAVELPSVLQIQLINCTQHLSDDLLERRGVTNY